MGFYVNARTSQVTLAGRSTVHGRNRRSLPESAPGPPNSRGEPVLVHRSLRKALTGMETVSRSPWRPTMLTPRP